jgi:hypothetical protein
VNDLYERLAAVEKQNRNLRIALTAIGCGLFVTVAAAADTGKGAMVIKSHEGKILGRLPQ